MGSILTPNDLSEDSYDVLVICNGDEILDIIVKNYIDEYNPRLS